MRFTFRQLEYFVAVGEAGSIALASERISISPPSISTAIGQLESEFGLPLFVRHHAQGLTLTTAGRELFRETKALLEQANGLHALASELADQIRGPLSVGCLITVAPRILPALRRAFESAHPHARIRQHEADHPTLMDLLRRAEIDAAITYDLEISGDIDFEPLATLPPYALVAADHPLADRDAVTLEDLAEVPIVMLDLPHSREYFHALFRARWLRPEIAERTPHVPTLISLVGNGFGAALLNLPLTSMTSSDGRPVRAVPLAGDHRPMVLGLARMAGTRTSKILDAFAEFCRDVITDSEIPAQAVLSALDQACGTVNEAPDENTDTAVAIPARTASV